MRGALEPRPPTGTPLRDGLGQGDCQHLARTAAMMDWSTQLYNDAGYLAAGSCARR